MISEMDGSTANFFIGLSGLGFGVSGFAGALELLRQLIGKPQELRYLNSIVWLAGLVIMFSLLPLMLIGVNNAMAIGSWSIFAASVLLFLFITWEVVHRKVAIQYPIIFGIAYIATLGGLAVLYFNAVYWQSIIIYKACMMWALFLLLLRFTLFVRYISQLGHAPEFTQPKQ